jgi:tRNA A37 threonylcarbamoyladenosine dehydratase
MAAWTERAELLFKKEGIEKLRNSNILIVGVGGVGSFAAEFIARAGVGKMTIVDGDVVDITTSCPVRFANPPIVAHIS